METEIKNENAENATVRPKKVTKEDFQAEDNSTRGKALYVAKSILFLLLSSFLVSFSVYSLISPNHFTIGGASGIAILINAKTGISQSILVFCINLPLIVCSFFFVKKKFDIRMMFSNGGMPSSHSSTVLALSTAAAIHCGFNSPAFAISGVLSVIVMNDAFGVRWQAGQQAQIINKMIMELFSNTDQFDVKLKEIIGHTPFQVFMGALLGFIVALAYGLLLNACGADVIASCWL